MESLKTLFWDRCKFSLYISPLEDVIRAHGLNAMMYADDSQLYIIMRQSNLAIALQDLTLCNQDIMSFFNMLKCNSKKTEIIHFSSLPSSADPVPLLDLFFEIVLPQKRKLDPLESFKYHIHQHRGNKV